MAQKEFLETLLTEKFQIRIEVQNLLRKNQAELIVFIWRKFKIRSISIPLEIQQYIYKQSFTYNSFQYSNKYARSTL